MINFICLIAFFKKSSPSNKVLRYDYTQEYWTNLREIYDNYMNTKSNDLNCSHRFSGIAAKLNEQDFDNAFKEADKMGKDYFTKDKIFIANDQRATHFNYDLYQANLYSKFNEYATKRLVINKCLNKYETIMNLPSNHLPERVWYLNRYCDLERSVGPQLNCDPKAKYRSVNGKCNNLFKTNWGSSFRCNRRLLPPDYADGVSQPRVASNGQPLPNPRLITKSLMPDMKSFDPILSSLHMSWGQFVVHDVIKTLQYFGHALDCCPQNRSSIHEECLTIDNIPTDELSIAYKQSCIGVVRSIACNTCSLGHREQLNAATPTLDLSNLYGGNENNTNSLRSFKKGQLRGDTAADGSDILPKAILPNDQDTFDNTECRPPPDKPRLTCFLNGDGARSNQQPLISSLLTIMRRRHNYHANSLSKFNPHWNDETLYQESRRILIAEYTKIIFSEYLSKIIGQEVMDFYDLNVKEKGFTKYDPKVDPTAIQAVIVAAFRFGHSQVTSHFPVIKKKKFDSYGIHLRSKFNDVSDIWEGNANGLIGGLISVPARTIDPYIVTDVHDHLFFNSLKPRINDLPAMSISRGRDHGVPGYVHYFKYCSGVHIKGWPDLSQYIPEEYLKKMSSIYKDVRDIDLFVGGLAERHMNGSKVGPTFGCLLAIQFFHWKFGDRFYFEHGGQAGSFTNEQLNNIRNTSSLANLICKTTDFDKIQSEPFLMTSKTNEKIPCNKFQDLDYKLWIDRTS